MTSAAEEIVAFTRRVEANEREDAETLRRYRNGTPHEATTEQTPADLVMAAERHRTGDDWGMRLETTIRAFGYFVARGPHPAKILLRIYRLGAHLRFAPFCEFSDAQRSLILHDAPATHRWLMQLIAGDDSIVAREGAIERALAKFQKRTGYKPRDEYVPLDSILPPEHDDESEIARETIVGIFVYITADGGAAGDILRLTFALGAHMGIEPFCDFTLREKKLLLGGSHGTHHWVNKKRCEDPLRRLGAKAWKGPGQKTLGARKGYSRSQEGNTNRAGKKL